MKKDISLSAFIDRAKAMMYMMALSAIAFLVFAVLTSLSR
jgi:hypothetical protein